MSEFFLELFTEEMPPRLQNAAKEDLLKIFKEFLDQQEIAYNESYLSTSTPHRLVIYFKDIKKFVLRKSEEIRGPRTNSHKDALEGFLKSKKLTKKKIYKKRTEKGEFYFYKI